MFLKSTMTVSCGFLLQQQFWAQFDIAEKCLGFRRHLNNVSNWAQIHQSLPLKVKGLSDALVYLYFSFHQHLRQSWCLKQTISKILDLGVLRYLLWMYHVFLGCFNKKKTFWIVFQNLKMKPFTDHLISGLLERPFQSCCSFIVQKIYVRVIRVMFYGLIANFGKFEHSFLNNFEMWLF